MIKEKFEIENIKFILKWVESRNQFIDPRVLVSFLGITSEQLYLLVGKIEDELACRILSCYKDIGYFNYSHRFESYKNCYKNIGLEIINSSDYFKDEKIFKARFVTKDSLIVKGANFIDQSLLLKEMQYSSDLLGNFGVLPEQKNAVYFMPSDVLTQRLNLDNRPKVVIKGSSNVQKKLLDTFLTSENGEVEMSELYIRVYGGCLKDFYDDRNKLYVLIKSFNQSMKSILSLLEEEGLNLARISLSKGEENIYDFIILNKEDSKDTSICYLNYFCNGKISF